MERRHGASCLTSLHTVDGWNYGWMWYLSVPCHKMRKITLFPNYQFSSTFPKHFYSIKKWNNSSWKGDKILRKVRYIYICALTFLWLLISQRHVLGHCQFYIKVRGLPSSSPHWERLKLGAVGEKAPSRKDTRKHQVTAILLYLKSELWGNSYFSHTFPSTLCMPSFVCMWLMSSSLQQTSWGMGERYIKNSG